MCCVNLISCKFLIYKICFLTSYGQISSQNGGLRKVPIFRRGRELAFVLNKREDLSLQMSIPFFRNSILFGFPRHFSAITRNLALFDISVIQLSRQGNRISKKTLYTFLDIGLFFYLKKTVALYLFYSLRNRFRTLQKSDFEKTKRHLCDMCERV